MQIKGANLPDRSVRYLEAGSGRAALLLHAFPLSADQWLPQLHQLPPGWRAVAPDFRGFRPPDTAAADASLDAVTMETYAADVQALMAHLDIQRAVVVGLSMGGYVAFALMRRAPQLIQALVLANTRATPDSAEGLVGRDRLIAAVERAGAPAVTAEMLPKMIGQTSRREQPDLEGTVRRLIEANSTAAITAALRAMKGRPDSTPLLATVGCPSLVIAGEEDALIPAADIAAMRLAIPGTREVTIPRAGHLTNLEAPAAFNQALSEFLMSIPV
jgi:pimeloyl-ACP methyl ester carboxylesterase